MAICNTKESYGAVTKCLHWLIALMVIAMLCVGVSFNYVTNKTLFSTLMFLHKSTGVALLLLMIIRLLWRFANPVPRLPEKTPTWEHIAIRLIHYLFYLLVIAMPITGILMSTLRGYRDLPFYGLFNISLSFMPLDKTLSDLMANWHEIIAWAIGALIVLHTLAALKHHFINKNNILKRMMPGK